MLKVVSLTDKEALHFRRDFETMFTNARTYNDPDSQVVRDATMIEAKFDQLYESLLVSTGKAPTNRKRVIPDDEDEDDDDPSSLPGPQQTGLIMSMMPGQQPPMPTSNQGIKLKFGGGGAGGSGSGHGLGKLGMHPE